MVKVGLIVALIGLSIASAWADSGAGNPPPSSPPPSSSPKDNIFYGGNLGFGFGDVDYVEIAPLVGYRFNEQFSAGGGISFRYYNDDRSGQSLSSNAYGVTAFGRYRPLPPAFIQVQYELTRYDEEIPGGGSVSDNYAAYLLGGGYVRPLGNHASFVATLMYDFHYSDNSFTPYDSPWRVAVGVNVGF